MKPILVALFLVLTFNQPLTFAQQEARRARRFIPEEPLLGPVHTVEFQFAKVYSPDDKEDQIQRQRHQKIVYDRQRKEIERINFKPDGSIENRSVQLLDANGRVIGWEAYETTADGKSERLTAKSIWTYDERGNRIEARTENPSTHIHITTTSYDDKGRPLEETIITDNGGSKLIKTNTYDANGYLAKTVYNTNGSIEVIEQTHDSAGHLLTYKHSGPKQENWQVENYVYDAFGRETERSGEDAILKWKVTTSYDVKGRVSQRVSTFAYKNPNVTLSEASEPGMVTFRYNDNNQVIEEAAFSPFGSLIRKTINEYENDGKKRIVHYFSKGVETNKVFFEYDKWGNWIKRWTKDTDAFHKPYLSISYRVITYYDDK